MLITCIQSNLFADAYIENDLIIPEGVTLIRDGAFYEIRFGYNYDIKGGNRLVLPESVISIDDEALLYYDEYSKVKVKSGSYAETNMINKNIPYETY